MHLSLSAAVLVATALVAPIISSTTPACSATSSVISTTSTVKAVVPIQPTVTYIPPTAPSGAPVVKIFEYNGGGFENLALRSNDQILATIAFPEPLLFYIDPLSIRPTVVLWNFTALRNTVGITELVHDIFYVAGEAADGGPFTIYSVDMRHFLVLPNGTIFTSPVVKRIGDIPSAIVLNGMTYLHRNDNFKFYVDSGKADLTIKDPSMAGPLNKTEYAAYGINGLRAQNNTLFYCNSGAQTFYKMPIHRDGRSAGEATLITSGIACDDFALDPWGFAYVASPRNALLKLDTRTGAQLVVAGTFNESTSDIISASSVRFGVSNSDKTSVYITTNGGAYLGAPPGSQGVSRVDVGDLAQAFEGREGEWK